MTRFGIAQRVCISLVITKLNLWLLKPHSAFETINLALITQAGFWFGTFLVWYGERRK